MGVPNPSLQTISIEIQWYILAPCLFFLLQKLNNVSKVVVFVVLILMSCLLCVEGESFASILFRLSIFNNLFYFIAGAMIYYFWNNVKVCLEGKFIIYLIIYVFICLLPIDNMFVKILSKFLLAAVTISAAFSYKTISNVLLRSHDISYGMYIYNMLVVNVFISLNFRNDVKYLFLALFLNIVLAFISWFLIERKFLRLKK